MRLKIATAFALLCFACLAMLLVKMTSILPDITPKTPAFSFDHDAVDGDEAFAILERFLEISPRDAGSDGATRAADFIAGALTSAGLKADTVEFESNTPNGKTTFRNVTTTIPGNGESCIVLLSHYDTKSGISKAFKGANDSGSSTALLLHMAALLKASTSSVPDIVIAFVDGEECMENYSSSDGLHGSKRLASSLAASYGRDNIVAAILLDMIGDKDLTITVPKNSTPRLTKLLFDAARKENKRELFSLYGPMLDDHVPFLDMGVPAIDIIDFHYGSSALKNDYWHTKEDALDKIAPESLETVGRITIRLMNSLLQPSPR